MTTSHGQHTVSLRGLFTAAGHFIAELGHVDLEQDGLSVLCFHGGVQVQVPLAAATVENRCTVVGDAASLLGSDPRITKHNHAGSNPDTWGAYEVFGHYMEAPLWAWTLITQAEAERMGWGPQ